MGDDQLRPGDRLGEFRVTAKLGCGGMGCVYSAEDRRDPSIVRALKIIKPELMQTPELRWRFRYEAKLLATVSHQNLVAFHGFRELGGHHALVLELLQGESLGSEDCQGPDVPLTVVLRWLHDAAAALAYLHDHEHEGQPRAIVHRDVKPLNLFVTNDGVVKLLDLGVARALVDAQTALGTTLTSAGAIHGSPGYIPPELLRGERPTPAADVFALGITAFELLTGEHPLLPPGIQVFDPIVLAARALFEDVPALSSVRPDVPPWLADLVDRMVRKEPEARPASGAAVLAELAPHVAALPLAPPPSAAARRPSTAAVEAPVQDDVTGTRAWHPEADTPAPRPDADEGAAAATRAAGPLRPAEEAELRRLGIVADETIERLVTRARSMADSFRLMAGAAMKNDPAADEELTHVVNDYNPVYDAVRSGRRQGILDLKPFFEAVPGLRDAATAMWGVALDDLHLGAVRRINEVRAAIFESRRMRAETVPLADREAADRQGVTIAHEVARDIDEAVDRLEERREHFRKLTGLDF